MYTLKKSLGQHFLRDENICRKIIAALNAGPGIKLLEVGPGGGALTRYLVQLSGIDFRAVEVDSEKVEYLARIYPGLRDKIIHGSILSCPPPFEGKFTLIGNFPYNISSQVLFRILEWKSQVETVIGMFQKEVAERISAGNGNKDYGILSVLLQAFYKTEYLFEVGEKCFQPPPRVKSAVIRLQYLGNHLGVESEPRFTALVKAAFGQRRKKLRNPLKPLFDEETLKEDIFNRRAEELTVKDFVDLSKRML